MSGGVKVQEIINVETSGSGTRSPVLIGSDATDGRVIWHSLYCSHGLGVVFFLDFFR